MLYEVHVDAEHARSFCDVQGLLLQSLDNDGHSKHPEFRKLQEQAMLTRSDRLLSPYDDRVADPEPSFLQDPSPCSSAGAACSGFAR
jgi:hypothetical protein